MIRPWVTHLALDIGEHIPDFAPAVLKLASYLAPRSLDLYIYNEAEDAETFDWDLGRLPRAREDQSVFFGCFPTVVSLDLSITCQSFLEVIELVTSFPLLEDLKVSASWDENSEVMPSSDADGPLLLPTRIRSLTLVPSRPSFLQWFLRHRPLQTPSKLDLRLHGDLHSHGQLIRQAGPCLTHLKINSVSSVLLSESLTIQENPSLRSLHITVWDSAVRIMLRLLSQLPGDPTALEEVEFQAWEAGNDDVDVDSLWEQLDHLLTRARFTALRKVTVSVLRPHCSVVKQRLARVNSSKILWLKDQSGNLLD
ncbi:hypothetical protein H0H87_012077 [Tephrocybe sp. NHM501043]|nr:hypothetical protein H0H87_012077 [Tephrocybe sp. NHM501043]